MLSLTQRLQQLQKLSPQQIQYQKLLQLNTLSLEQRIKTELELNPILEETLTDEYDLEVKQDEEKPEENESGETEEDEYVDEKNPDDEFGVEDYMNDVEELDNDYVYRNQEEEKLQPVAPLKETLNEHLLNQLYFLF